MGIGDKLRRRRVEMGLSRNQLAEKVRVTPSSIANYENGISYPKPDILISLILALDIDANYLYQDYLNKNMVQKIYGSTLSPEEMDSVAKYKELPESGKHLIRTIIEEEYARLQKEQWVTLPCWQPGIRKLYSGFIRQEQTQTIRIPGRNLPKGTQFCFQVQIDRYEPIFQKGDILALSNEPAGHNELGIFQLNDILYIRTLYQDESSCKLHALNVIDPDIQISEEDQFQCIGKILGKVYGNYELRDN